MNELQIKPLLEKANKGKELFVKKHADDATLLVRGMFFFRSNQICLHLCCIMLTRPYNVLFLKPHFCMVKLGLQGYIFFCFCSKHR